jgi:hypothetical protein
LKEYWIALKLTIKSVKVRQVIRVHYHFQWRFPRTTCDHNSCPAGLSVK